MQNVLAVGVAGSLHVEACNMLTATVAGEVAADKETLLKDTNSCSALCFLCLAVLAIQSAKRSMSLGRCTCTVCGRQSHSPCRRSRARCPIRDAAERPANQLRDGKNTAHTLHAACRWLIQRRRLPGGCPGSCTTGPVSYCVMSQCPCKHPAPLFKQSAARSKSGTLLHTPKPAPQVKSGPADDTIHCNEQLLGTPHTTSPPTNTDTLTHNIQPHTTPLRPPGTRRSPPPPQCPGPQGCPHPTASPRQT